MCVVHFAPTRKKTLGKFPRRYRAASHCSEQAIWIKLQLQHGMFGTERLSGQIGQSTRRYVGVHDDCAFEKSKFQPRVELSCCEKLQLQVRWHGNGMEWQGKVVVCYGGSQP